MSLEHWLLFLHILGAIVWIGGGLMLSFFGLRARATADLRIIAEFSRTSRRFGLTLFMPALVVLLGTGIWMVLAHTGSKLSEPWILIGFALFFLAFLIGAFYLSRVGIALEQAVADPGRDVKSASVLIGRWLVGYGVILLVLVAAVWDMVFKPFA